MEKSIMFKIMNKSPREKVIELAGEIEKDHTITIVKKPAKTLVMLKMREPVANSEYFLGELLACEAMVKIGDSRGMAVTAGDDFEKVLAMAIIDAACNAGIGEFYQLTEKLREWDTFIKSEEEKEFARSMRSKVQFSVMEGR